MFSYTYKDVFVSYRDSIQTYRNVLLNVLNQDDEQVNIIKFIDCVPLESTLLFLISTVVPKYLYLIPHRRILTGKVLFLFKKIFSFMCPCEYSCYKRAVNTIERCVLSPRTKYGYSRLLKEINNMDYSFESSKLDTYTELNLDVSTSETYLKGLKLYTTIKDDTSPLGLYHNSLNKNIDNIINLLYDSSVPVDILKTKTTNFIMKRSNGISVYIPDNMNIHTFLQQDALQFIMHTFISTDLLFSKDLTREIINIYFYEKPLAEFVFEISVEGKLFIELCNLKYNGILPTVNYSINNFIELLEYF